MASITTTTGVFHVHSDEDQFLVTCDFQKYVQDLHSVIEDVGNIGTAVMNGILFLTMTYS